MFCCVWFCFFFSRRALPRSAALPSTVSNRVYAPTYPYTAAALSASRSGQAACPADTGWQPLAPPGANAYPAAPQSPLIRSPLIRSPFMSSPLMSCPHPPNRGLTASNSRWRPRAAGGWAGGRTRTRQLPLPPTAPFQPSTRKRR